MLHELCPWFATVELSGGARESDAAWAAEEARAWRGGAALRRKQSVVMHTSRDVLQDDGAGGLVIGDRVNSAIVTLVQSLEIFPSFLRAKAASPRMTWP